ncbi:hypothetical protein [Aerococcus urinaeequi]
MYYALSIKEENIRKTYIDFAKKWQVRRNREIILRDAQDVHPISMSAFDTNKYLLNCKNGTLIYRRTLSTRMVRKILLQKSQVCIMIHSQDVSGGNKSFMK